MTIKYIPADELAALVAGLVKQGLTFEATPDNLGTWTIKLLGGF